MCWVIAWVWRAAGCEWAYNDPCRKCERLYHEVFYCNLIYLSSSCCLYCLSYRHTHCWFTLYAVLALWCHFRIGCHLGEALLGRPPFCTTRRYISMVQKSVSFPDFTLCLALLWSNPAFVSDSGLSRLTLPLPSSCHCLPCDFPAWFRPCLVYR